MGITGNRRDPYDLGYIEDEINRIDNYQEHQANRQEGMAVDTPSSPAKSRKIKKSPFYRCLMDRSIRAKKKGARQTRRVENTQYLLVQSEQDEPDIPNVNEFVDLMEHGLTPFATLFVEQQKMQIWNEFINHSEDDQLAMLTKKRQAGLQREDNARNDSTSSWEDVTDSRAVHPGYSAKECFEKIDHRLRHLLTRRHLPMGTLVDLEVDLMTFFTDWPQSVYICHLETSFDRMLLHALCQYLRLQSNSYDDESGTRQTQVENSHSHFIPPATVLSQYIESRDGKH